MKKWILIFGFFLKLIFVMAQQPYGDSLKKLLISAKEDTNKVNLYANIAWEFLWSYPDTSLNYSSPGLELAGELHFKKGEIHNLNWLGEALAQKGNYPKALEMQFKAMELAKELKDADEIAVCNAMIGSVYYYSKDYNNALIFYLKAKGSSYKFLASPKLLLGFIGETYFHLGELDSALLYIQKAYDLDIKDKGFHWTVPYTYLGLIEDQKGNTFHAIELYRTAMSIGFSRLDTVAAYSGLAALFKKTNQIDSAIIYAKKAIIMGSSFPTIVMEAGKLLVDIFKSQHLTDSAFKYQQMMLAAKDTLFSREKVMQMQSLSFNEKMHQQEMQQLEYENVQERRRVGQWRVIASLGGLILVFLLIMFSQWRNSKQKKKANLLLLHQKEKLESTLSELRTTQSQLIQSEKMASLGELTAGIAHEIQNPLNFVNNFSEVNNELIEEVKNQIPMAIGTKLKSEEINELLNDIFQNNEKIKHHGKRADAIVKGMLQHSRASSGQKEPTDVNALADEYLRLAYHGLRAKDKSFSATMKTDFDQSIGNINIIQQDIGRVVLNLINNAFYAVDEKKKQNSTGYEPTVSVSTKKLDGKVEIKVTDNGNGIPQKVLDKIFQPFFTTKPTGQGTGLGLSLAYDIIKAHGGELKVETKEGEGSEFIVQIPKYISS